MKHKMNVFLSDLGQYIPSSLSTFSLLLWFWHQFKSNKKEWLRLFFDFAFAWRYRRRGNKTRMMIWFPLQSSCGTSCGKKQYLYLACVCIGWIAKSINAKRINVKEMMHLFILSFFVHRYYYRHARLILSSFNYRTEANPIILLCVFL